MAISNCKIMAYYYLLWIKVFKYGKYIFKVRYYALIFNVAKTSCII